MYHLTGNYIEWSGFNENHQISLDEPNESCSESLGLIAINFGAGICS